MTDIIFKFDTEDYINPYAADGLLNIINILNKAGFKGCFQIVGKFAEALKKWNRTDIIEALKEHEIDIHSLAHSHHPTINEYTDLEDFDKALEIFYENEKECIRILKETFGVSSFNAACPPGASTSYVAHYGYYNLGIPVYIGDYSVDEKLGRPLFCCNVACLESFTGMDHFCDIGHKEIDDILERASKRNIAVLSNHPAMHMITTFCDELNFKGENTPENEWVLSPKRSEKDIETFIDNFSYMVESIKNNPQFRVVTCADINKRYCSSKRIIKRENLIEIKKQLDCELFPVTLPDSFCISDIFLACRDFLLGKEEHICGKVYGFLSEPYSADKELKIRYEDIKASANEIKDGFIPERIRVGTEVIGPSDWLYAALELLCEGKDETIITKKPWQIDFDQFPILKTLNHKGNWIHSKDFEDKYLSDRMRLQSWTYRLPANTQRKIF